MIYTCVSLGRLRGMIYCTLSTWKLILILRVVERRLIESERYVVIFGASSTFMSSLGYLQAPLKPFEPALAFLAILPLFNKHEPCCKRPNVCIIHASCSCLKRPHLHETKKVKCLKGAFIKNGRWHFKRYLS